jgi:hypothetical protein
MFDDTSAFLDAKLFVPEADYIIDLYDAATTPRTWIMSITNSTTSGMIQEDWGVTNADGSVCNATNVAALFTVLPVGTLSSASTLVRPMGRASGNNPPPSGPTKILTRAAGSLSEWGPNFDVAFFYMPTNDALRSAFAKDGGIWNGMQGVVDALTMPQNGYDVYNSTFNHYTCYYCSGNERPYPGYISSQAIVTNNLLPDIANGLTKQLYIKGHGTNGWLGSGTGDAYLTGNDVSQRLTNHYSKKGGLVSQNPYRFVFLDGCSTASGKDWRRAFGIYPMDAQNQAGRNKTGPQAYVGWADVHAGFLGYSEDTADAINLATGYTQMLHNFYSMWMEGATLKDCIDVASVSTSGVTPLPVPQNKDVLLFGNGYRFQYTNILTSKIYIIGFPGLKVDRTDTSLNPDKTYAAPVNIE